MGTLADVDEFRHGAARTAEKEASMRHWRDITAASLRAADERDRREDAKSAKETRRIVAWIVAICLVAVAIGMVLARGAV